MTKEVNFDDLSRKTIQSDGAMEDLNNLYGHAFALPEWHFIARGEFPNFNPYIASNAEFAGGRQMVRAFTDTARLQRFAKENNLTQPNGGNLILSIPTGKIVDYLEQFISHGVYGIWFNSDTESEGFFVPLQQLRPIKEYLGRINWENNIIDSPSAPPAESLPDSNIKLDTLSKLIEENAELIAGYDEENAMLSAIIGGSAEALDIRIKEEKAAVISNCAEMLDSVRKENNMSPKLFEFFIELCLEKRKFITPVLAFAVSTREEDKTRRLEQDEELTKELARWIINKLVPNSDILLPPADVRAAQSPGENWGLSQSPDGEIEQMLTINQVGAVNFDTSIAPFYQAITPLLENYQGSGEYNKLLSFDPNEMSDLVENIADNAHGAYLRIRRFHYLNPKNNTRIGVNSIHSNQLRHVQSNGTLNLSFELCKNLDNQTAAFYFAFLGAGSEVKKLVNVIQPILNQCGFESV
jgi:hypothetical protein